MKHSIRTRITSGMIFLFLIILVLSVFSGYYMNKLSNKTSAILKENYLSVVYAREMSQEIMNINREITACFLMNRNLDSLIIKKELNSINESLSAEKNNITEAGEDKLVSDIETDFIEYKKAVLHVTNPPKPDAGMLYLQNKAGDLQQKLSLLSQMNGKALEVKTDDAKASSKNALTQMTILASLCFLIGLSFAYSFGSYFNRKIFQLYNGIKEIVSSNFSERLFFYENDEFYEISLVINEMADKLKENERKMSVPLQEDFGKKINPNDVEELQKMLFRIKIMEEQAAALISKFEKKQY